MAFAVPAVLSTTVSVPSWMLSRSMSSGSGADSSARSSSRVMVRPLLRNAVCWKRARIVSKSKRTVSKIFVVGPERHRRAGLGGVLERLVLREGRHGHAVLEGHPEDVAALAHLDVEPLGEGVDHGRADAVQATGHLVAAAAELAAGVQLGQDELDGGDVLAVALAGGDAAAVVGDAHRAVGQDRHVDVGRVAGQGLVDGVVDDLPDQVVQAALAGRPDVHAGPLADGVESLEDLDLGGVVLVLGLRGDGCGGGARHVASVRYH